MAVPLMSMSRLGHLLGLEVKILLLGVRLSIVAPLDGIGTLNTACHGAWIGSGGPEACSDGKSL